MGDRCGSGEGNRCARDLEGWPYGLIALGAKEPNTLDNGWQVETIKFRLNEGLVDWAFEQTRTFLCTQ